MMLPVFPSARSWVLPAVVLVALAGCDRSPTEPIDMPFEAAKGGGGSGAGKPGLVERIAFGSDHAGFMGIYVVDPNGQSPATLVTTPPANMSDGEPSLTPGSTRVAFTRSNSISETSEIYSATLDGLSVQQLTNFNAITLSPVFSPDGKKIAFVSNKPHPGKVAQVNLFVMNDDGSNLQLVDSTRMGSRPSWSADGKTLYYGINGVTNGTYHTFLVTKHLISGVRNYFYGCPNSECVNPMVDHVTGRVIFEMTPGGQTLPMLWMWVNGSTVFHLWGLPPATTGGWSKDGSKFVYAEMVGYGYGSGVALQILDVTSVGSGSLVFSDLVTPATWAATPTWSR